MSDIQDNPLSSDDLADTCEAWLRSGGASNIVDAFETGHRHGEAAAFSRGVAAGQAAMQGEIEALRNACRNAGARSVEVVKKLCDERRELRAKLKALEEQKPVAWINPKVITEVAIEGGAMFVDLSYEQETNTVPLYAEAGAKS